MCVKTWAKAVERAKDIKQEGALKRQKNLAEARYAAKLAEIESRARLEQRAAGRLQAGWLRDQESTEIIMAMSATASEQMRSYFVCRRVVYAAQISDR